MRKEKLHQFRKDLNEIIQFLISVCWEIAKELCVKVHVVLFNWFEITHDSKAREIVFTIKPHLRRKVEAIKLTYHLFWHKENRQILVFRVMSAAPEKRVVFGASVPFLFGLQFDTRYTALGWNRKGREGKPFNDVEHSFHMSLTEMNIVIGDKHSDNSFHVNWKEILKSLTHRQRAYVIEDGGWYTAIVPVNDVGDFKSEKLRIKVRRLTFKTVNWVWFKTTEKFETLYTFDLGDGIVVPDDYNVYDDHVLTGTTLKGIDNHMEAIKLLVDHITTSRKRRPKPNE
jgi:hypothetical protein